MGMNRIMICGTNPEPVPADPFIRRTARGLSGTPTHTTGFASGFDLEEIRRALRHIAARSERGVADLEASHGIQSSQTRGMKTL